MWTSSRKETLEVLLNIYFPNCDAGKTSVLEDIITRDRVKWAINFFEPFKSPVGIFPALFQHAGDILHEYLVDAYRDCLRWCDIPEKCVCGI